VKTASTALKAHMAGEQTTLAGLWKVKRRDGTLLGFTAHDKDLTFDDGSGDGSIVYTASTGFTPSATEAGADLAVDNLQIVAFLDSDSVSESDVAAGKYNYCKVELSIVNWVDLTMGRMKLRKGTLGQVKVQNGQFSAEIRGLSFYFGTVIGRSFSPLCDADLGDTRCTVDLTPLTQTGSANVVTDAREFTPAAGLSPAGSGYFTDGILTFTSGANNGAAMEIANWDGTTITLFESMPFPVAHGDTFTIEPGCDHTTGPAGCGKFSNIINYQGFPQMPGTDQILNYPDVST
jgi:uncharacterized phage protein (TIGR02218 family)